MARYYQINWPYVFSLLFIVWLVGFTGLLYFFYQTEMYARDVANQTLAQQLLNE